MIEAVFHRAPQGLCAFRVSGHAGFAESGDDIVCASVTSAVQLTCNGVTEILGTPAEVELAEDLVGLTLPQPFEGAAGSYLQALHLHMTLLQQQFPEHITVTVLEV